MGGGNYIPIHYPFPPSSFRPTTPRPSPYSPTDHPLYVRQNPVRAPPQTTIPIPASLDLAQSPTTPPTPHQASSPKPVLTSTSSPLIGGDFKHHNTDPPSSKSISSLLSNHGKTAIVTGAGAGIGLAVAEALAESGANVAIWYHGNREAIKRAREIEERWGVKCRAYISDIRQYDPIASLVDTVLHDFNGRLDIFVANAGIPWKEGTFLDGSVDHYRNVMATDLDSVFYCARAAGRVWRRQKDDGVDLFGRRFDGNGVVEFKAGSFIATTSMSAHIVNVPQLQAAYNAAKAGVIQLVKSVAVEMVQFARANTVSPGYILTEISDYVPEETKKIWRGKTPMGREGEPHELKGAFVYLASELGSYTTGSDILVDGGYTLV